MGFRSGLITGHFRTVQCCCFLTIPGCYLRTHVLRQRCSFVTLGGTLRSKIPWQSPEVMMPRTDSRHPVPEAAKQPQNNLVNVVFVEGFSKHRFNGIYQKASGLWLVQVCFSKHQLGFLVCLSQQWGPPGSPTIEPPFIELATDGASWNGCTLCLFGSAWICFAVVWGPFCTIQAILCYNLCLLQTFLLRPLLERLATVPWERLDNIAHGGHLFS